MLSWSRTTLKRSALTLVAITATAAAIGARRDVQAATKDVVQCGTRTDWAQVDRLWFGTQLDTVYTGCDTLAS